MDKLFTLTEHPPWARPGSKDCVHVLSPLILTTALRGMYNWERSHFAEGGGAKQGSEMLTDLPQMPQ